MKHARLSTRHKVFAELQEHVKVLMAFGVLCRVVEEHIEPVEPAVTNKLRTRQYQEDLQDNRINLGISYRNALDKPTVMWYLKGLT